VKSLVCPARGEACQHKTEVKAAGMRGWQKEVWEEERKRERQIVGTERDRKRLSTKEGGWNRRQIGLPLDVVAKKENMSTQYSLFSRIPDMASETIKDESR